MDRGAGWGSGGANGAGVSLRPAGVGLLLPGGETPPPSAPLGRGAAMWKGAASPGDSEGVRATLVSRCWLSPAATLRFSSFSPFYAIPDGSS